MDQPATIGLDLAKNVFQVHGVDSEGMDLSRLNFALCVDAMSCLLW